MKMALFVNKCFLNSFCDNIKIINGQKIHNDSEKASVNSSGKKEKSV